MHKFIGMFALSAVFIIVAGSTRSDDAKGVDRAMPGVQTVQSIAVFT